MGMHSAQSYQSGCLTIHSTDLKPFELRQLLTKDIYFKMQCCLVILPCHQSKQP